MLIYISIAVSIIIAPCLLQYMSYLKWIDQNSRTGSNSMDPAKSTRRISFEPLPQDNQQLATAEEQ